MVPRSEKSRTTSSRSTLSTARTTLSLAHSLAHSPASLASSFPLLTRAIPTSRTSMYPCITGSPCASSTCSRMPVYTRGIEFSFSPARVVPYVHVLDRAEPLGVPRLAPAGPLDRAGACMGARVTRAPGGRAHGSRRSARPPLAYIFVYIVLH
jgi:hypothetical protein